MEYKVLINLYVPEIQESYELYIPINKHIDDVIKILSRAVNEMSYGVYPIKDGLSLCDRRTGELFDKGSYVRNTSIGNGTQLILF